MKQKSTISTGRRIIKGKQKDETSNSLDDAAVRHMVSEFEVHKIEPEMQNSERVRNEQEGEELVAYIFALDVNTNKPENQ